MQSARTVSTFCSRSPVSAIRLSAYAEGSTGSPFSVISWISAPTRSANVSAPGSLQPNSMVVVDANVVRSLSGAPERSRSTVYDVTESRAARVAASSRVRLVPGMAVILPPPGERAGIGQSHKCVISKSQA